MLPTPQPLQKGLKGLLKRFGNWLSGLRTSSWIESVSMLLV